MNTVILAMNDSSDKSVIDNWIAENPQAVIKFVTVFAPYQILIFYEVTP